MVNFSCHIFGSLAKEFHYDNVLLTNVTFIITEGKVDRKNVLFRIINFCYCAS